MGRSKGVMISVKVPINWDAMTDKKKTRLNRITGRDTRVIKAYLGVIVHHENELLKGPKRRKIDPSLLDKLTLTASKGKADREKVPHDFKKKFRSISVNEFQECRDTAIAMWQSYLERGGSRPLHAKLYSTRKILRFAFAQRFELVYSSELKIKHWLKLRDSLDSVVEKRRLHDKLSIPLSMSSFHLNQMKMGDVKTARVLRDRRRKWWAIFTVTLETKTIGMGIDAKPPAVLSIDLGICKAACSVLLTRQGYKHIKYWKQEDRFRRMKRLDDRIASLQREKEHLVSRRLNSDRVTATLRQLSGKRNRISMDLDKKLVRSLTDHIAELAQSYNLYVTIGRLKGIRNRARRGNYSGRRYRGMIHRWTLARIRDMLQHKLAVLGLDEMRFKSIPEQWTSIMCHKCGHKGIRPRQSVFICHTCGYKANADLNGAINIGKRLIMLIPSLRNEKGLGMWLTPRERAILKARREKSSAEGKSSPPQRSPASKGRSVADHNDQMAIESFASGKDPAMVNAVERPSAIARTGECDVSMQRRKAGSHPRNAVPVTRGKAHDTLRNLNSSEAGDGSRVKGGAQRFLVIRSES